MSDITTRLLLKTNDFDANLNRAKGSVNSFQGGISSMAKTAGAGIMKFAGTIGIAVGTSEAFMKTIRGSQTTSDEFDAQMRTCQTSVNEFFTSLSTGDFTYFLGGLDSIISKSRDAYAALDQLGNARISYDYFREDFNAAMAESRSVAMDNEAPKEQREAALGVWAKAIEDKKKKAESVKSDALTALKAVVVEGNLLHSDDITLEDVDKAFSYDVAGKDRDSLKSAVANRYDTYKIKYAELERRKKSGGIADWAFPESKESKDRAAFNDFIASKQAELNKEYKDAIIFNDLLVKKKDEELIKVGQLGKEYKQINQELANDKKTFDRVRDRVNKPKKNPKENEEKKPLKDTLSWYDAEISRLNKKLSKETTMQARATVQAAINELEKKKVNIKIVVEQEVFKGKYGDMKGGLPSINRPGDQLGLKHNDTGFKLSKFESPIKKKDIDLNKLYAESLGSIANSFGSMTSMSEQFGNEGVSFMFNAMGSISQMIVQLQSLATAQGVASAFALPFPANLGAIATVIATVTSIFASLPKFETGGVVPGISFGGDKVLARVNSGEMILNGSQQANLFKMLNSKLYAGLDVSQPNITPSVGHLARLIAPSENKVQVEFGKARVVGPDIILSVNNTLKKQGKKPL